MRTLILGDIHGHNDALQRVLTKAQFDENRDRIICLGDYVDGGENTFEVVSFLIRLEEAHPDRHIFLLGNHDAMFLDILKTCGGGFQEEEFVRQRFRSWWEHGGEGTYRSYQNQSADVLTRHCSFFESFLYYYEEGQRLFVHAGFHPRWGLKRTFHRDPSELLTNRTLFASAVHRNDPGYRFDGWEKIFIGHTPTLSTSGEEPGVYCNVVNLDQGCKVNGRLTCWDLESGEWWRA